MTEDSPLTRPTMRTLIAHDDLRASLRLIWIATIIVIVRDVLWLALGLSHTLVSFDSWIGWSLLWSIAMFGSSLVSLTLLTIAVARTSWLRSGPVFRLAYAAAVGVLIMVVVVSAGRLAVALRFGPPLIHSETWRRTLFLVATLGPVLLVPLLALLAHRVNAALGGRLYERRIFVATIVGAIASVLVASTSVGRFLQVSIDMALEPLVGAAAPHMASFVRWMVQPLFCVWMLFVVRRATRRLRDLRRCPKCAYDLTGLLGANCPECGHDVARAAQLA